MEGNFGNQIEKRVYTKKESKEEKEKKKKRFNKFWRNKDYKIEVNGEMLTLKQCYDREIERKDAIFEATKKIMEKQIPKGKFILYVNSTLKGVAGHDNIKYIDRDRLKKMYRSETGRSKIDPKNFQKNNMCRRLGFEREDERFKVVNSFKEGMKFDLSNCVGIVLSGSEADVTDETILERMRIKENASEILKSSNSENLKRPIPKAAICFAAQLAANLAGAEIRWILDKNGNRVRVQGMKEIYTKYKKDAEALHPLLQEFLKFKKTTFCVAKNNGQKIDKNTLPEGVEILAENEDGDIEMFYSWLTNTLGTQFHPEADATRLDIGESVNNVEEPPNEIFTQDLDEIGEIFFSIFLNMAGEHARETMAT